MREIIICTYIFCNIFNFKKYIISLVYLLLITYVEDFKFLLYNKPDFLCTCAYLSIYNKKWFNIYKTIYVFLCRT